MIKKLIALLILIFVIGISMFSISKHRQDLNSNKLKITTSFYPLYFFTTQITGNKAQVINITPAGAEPHDYEPTPADIIQIDSSKLLIINGGVEPWADRIKNVKILEVGKDLINENQDPHIWLSPILAEKIADKITNQIIEIDPSNKDFYLKNLSELKSKLTKLDVDYKNGLKNCQQKNIITSHAAFGYLASEYNLKQISIAGLSPDSEPSLRELTEISNFVRLNNIKYIFFESLVSPKLSQTIASETGAKTLVLDPLEGSLGGDYLTVMHNNLQNLRTALQCQ